MCTTKLSVIAATLALLAQALGPGVSRGEAQDRSLAALAYEPPPPLEAPADDGAYRRARRASLGFDIAGIVTGAVGIVLGGPILLIAGTTRSHCEGGWFSSTPRTCASLPHDNGLVAGGDLDRRPVLRPRIRDRRRSRAPRPASS